MWVKITIRWRRKSIRNFLQRSRPNRSTFFYEFWKKTTFFNRLSLIWYQKIWFDFLRLPMKILTKTVKQLIFKPLFCRWPYDVNFFSSFVIFFHLEIVVVVADTENTFAISLCKCLGQETLPPSGTRGFPS